MLTMERYISLFLPEQAERLLHVRERKLDLAHYTSASNALRILRTGLVTLRNATLMNDFSEIDHGEKCLLNGWHGIHGRGINQPYDGRLFKILRAISPTIFAAIEQEYDAQLSARKSDTFLLSLAEHDDEKEGQLGRLSMWRAYGGKTNVAIVVNSDFLFQEAAGGAFSAPVVYSPVGEFGERHFKRLVDLIELNFEEVKALDRDYIVSALSLYFNVMAMTAKHPGFHEELEWRIIYAPWLNRDQNIKSCILDIYGVPQKVHQIDIGVLPESHSPTKVDNLIKKIIIGPTENPWVLYEAFVEELKAAQIPNAESKVVVSDIPIKR